jgi:hypothetical protein
MKYLAGNFLMLFLIQSPIMIIMAGILKMIAMKQRFGSGLWETGARFLGVKFPIVV